MQMELSGPWPVLRSGARLVDLPGAILTHVRSHVFLAQTRIFSSALSLYLTPNVLHDKARVILVLHAL
jgi:hypothetical protein